MHPTHLVTLSLTLLVLSPTSAIASQGRLFRDADGGISLYGFPPGETVRLGLDAAPTRQLTSNPCGLLVINTSDRYPLGTVQVEGEVVDPNTLNLQIQPQCRPSGGGHALTEARTQPFLTTSGNLVLVGKQPNTRYTVTYPGRLRLINRKANACGFVRLRETATIQFNQSILAPTTVDGTYAEFQVNGLIPLGSLQCYRNHLYYPADWTGWPLADSIPGSEVSEATVMAAQSLPSALGGSGSGSGGNSGGGSSGGSGGGSSGGGSGGSSGSSGGTGGTGGSGGGSSGGGSGGSSGTPWSPTDQPWSAGPGLTLPAGSGGSGNPYVGNGGIQRVCIGFDGSLVAGDTRLTRGTTYYLDGDEFSGSDQAASPASYGSTDAAPVLRFTHPSGTSYGSSQFHYASGEARYGYIGDAGFNVAYTFKFLELQSCLIPDWMQ